MSESSKRPNPEIDGPLDERPAEDVTNDSLGTVDTADSSGLDDEPESEKRRGEGIQTPGKN